MEVSVKKRNMKRGNNRRRQIKGITAGIGAALCVLLAGCGDGGEVEVSSLDPQPITLPWEEGSSMEGQTTVEGQAPVAGAESEPAGEIRLLCSTGMSGEEEARLMYLVIT